MPELRHLEALCLGDQAGHRTPHASLLRDVPWPGEAGADTREAFGLGAPRGPRAGLGGAAPHPRARHDTQRHPGKGATWTALSFYKDFIV